MSKQSFDALGVSAPVVRALSQRGIEAPFPIQGLVITDVLEGRDVLAKSPTGSGKTLAFAVPMVDLIEHDDPRPSALILAPTRELVSQIVDEMQPLAHSRALKVAAVYGGVGLEAQGKRARQAHIVVATPGRLEDQLQRRAFKLDGVKILVLDEADRMLDMGFRPAVDRLVARVPRDRQTLFFSATLDGEAGRIAREYTDEAVRHEHTPPRERLADIEHRFQAVTREDRLDKLVGALGGERELALVFVRTKRGADRLAKQLDKRGVAVAAMHGDKSQRQRERALASFADYEIDTLVATDVAARGIDVEGISHVIQYDPPDDRDGYVHRIGRTARAGRTGIGITFVDEGQSRDVEKIANDLRLETAFAATGLGRPARPAHSRSHTGGAPARTGGGRSGGGPGNRSGGAGGGGRRGGRGRSRSRSAR